MKGCIGKKLLSVGLSLALCATAVPMVSLSSSAANKVTPKVATGEAYTVVLKSDGSVWAAGSNNSGRLGINKKSIDVPKTATFTQCVDDTGATIKDATDIACGAAHTAVIRANGQLWQCGYNYYGQLGKGVKSSEPVNKFVQSQDKDGNKITDATAVACGMYHTAVIRAGGQLWQCGDNGKGQLGTGVTSSDPVTQFVQSQEETSGNEITDATAVACGQYHTAVIRANGQLWQCGWNDYGQLGTGDKNDTSQFVQSKEKTSGNEITDAEAVACGLFHTAVIRAGGQLWQCGSNDDGQLGTGDSGKDISGNAKQEPKFEKSKDKDGNAITDAEAVACGWGCTAVIRAGGQLWQCGNNGKGQLGTDAKSTTPVTRFEKSKDANGEITNVAAVSNGCEAYATLILRPDANGGLELLGAGQNSSGELGLGKKNDGQDNCDSPQPIFIKSKMADIGKIPGEILKEIGQPSSPHSVKGTGQFLAPTGAGSTVVTITWGDLTYNYNAKWNSEKQAWVKIDGATEFWQVAAADGDKITAISGSYNPVDVAFSFKAYGDYSATENGKETDDITGKFVTESNGDTEITGSKLSLTRLDKEKTTYLKLSGAPEGKAIQSRLEDQTFGVVTATLQDPNAEQQTP